MTDNEQDNIRGDSPSDIERLRNMLMQAQKQNTLNIQREAMTAVFCKCFAAVRAQKPLYLMFSGCSIDDAYWEQVRQTADAVMKLLPESAFTDEDGFTVTAIEPDTAGLYAPADVADGAAAVPPDDAPPLALYYAERVLGAEPQEKAEALLAAVNPEKPDMEPYENIYALCYYGQDEQIEEDPERFWHYWRMVATRRGEQIYGSLNSILKYLPKPALLYLRQKQEEQKANAAEKQARQKREKQAEEGRELLIELQNRTADIQSSAARIIALTEQPDAEDQEIASLLEEAEAAQQEITALSERLEALGEAAEESAQQAAPLLETVTQCMVEAKAAAEKPRVKEDTVTAVNRRLQTIAEEFASGKQLSPERIKEIRKTVSAQIELLSHENGPEPERLCRFAAHIQMQAENAERQANAPKQQEKASVPEQAQQPPMQQQAPPKPQPIQQAPPQRTVRLGVPQVQQAPPQIAPAEDTARKQAEQAANNAVMHYQEMRRLCGQANALDTELTAILRSIRTEPNSARSGAYRDRAKMLFGQTIGAWNQTAAASEQAATAAKDALRLTHPDHIRNQLQMMITEAQNLSGQAMQRIRQLNAAQTQNTPESKISGLMASAQKAYQAAHKLYLEYVQPAMMTAQRAEKEAQADGTPAAAMAQLLVVQRTYEQVLQMPDLLRGYEDRIIACTDAAMQTAPQVAREAEEIKRHVQTDRKNADSVVAMLRDMIGRLNAMAQLTAPTQLIGGGAVPTLPPKRDELCTLLAQILPMIEEANKAAILRTEGEIKRKMPAYPVTEGLCEGTMLGHKYMKYAKATHEVNINGTFWENYPQRFLSDSELGTKQHETAAQAKYNGTLCFVRMCLMHWTWDVSSEALRVNYGDASAALFCRTDTTDAFYCMMWAIAVFYQDDPALVKKLRSLPLFHKYFTQNCAAAFFGGKLGAERSNMCIFFALLHAGCMLQMHMIYPLLRLRSGKELPLLQHAKELSSALRLKTILDDTLYYGILQNGLNMNNYRLIRIWLFLDKLLEDEC